MALLTARTRRLLLGATLLAACAPPAGARVLMTREAALAQVFGEPARIEGRNLFLTPAQVRAVEQRARARLASPRVVVYRALRGDSLLGTAYLDTHVVRTMNETVLVALTPAGRVRAVEVLAFHEPEDYRPPARWLARFDGHDAADALRPGEAVPALGGATLSARALAAAVRRTLALHQVIAEGEER